MWSIVTISDKIAKKIVWGSTPTVVDPRLQVSNDHRYVLVMTPSPLHCVFATASVAVRDKVTCMRRLPVPTQGTDTPLYVDMVPLLSLGYHPLHGGGDGEGSSPSPVRPQVFADLLRDGVIGKRTRQTLIPSDQLNLELSFP